MKLPCELTTRQVICSGLGKVEVLAVGATTTWIRQQLRQHCQSVQMREAQLSTSKRRVDEAQIKLSLVLLEQFWERLLCHFIQSAVQHSSSDGFACCSGLLRDRLARSKSGRVLVSHGRRDTLNELERVPLPFIRS